MSIEKVVPSGEWLRCVYLKRLEKNPSYSLRAFARDAQLSHSHLSRVMTGQRNLSLKEASNLAERFHMEEPERLAFLRAVTETYLSKPIARRKQKSKSGKLLTLEVDRFRFISEWQHSAILELVSVKGFDPNTRWIARQLGLSSRTVKAALNRLSRLGLIEISTNRIKRTHAHLFVPSESSSAIRAFHTQMMEKALEQLRNGSDPALRDITGTTIALDPARIPEIKERIRKFRKSLMEFVPGDNTCGLYQLNVQFFSLLKASKKRMES